MSSSPFSSIIENASLFHFQSVLNYCWSTITVTLIITLGLFTGTQLSGYHPDNLKFPVNRSACTCDCWDGFFRGVHSRGGYKTFYINYEIQTIVLIGIFLFYAELLRNFLIKLVTSKRPILLLLLPAIYSNFYGIWNVINYLNDHDYNRMLPSQLYFSITELIANYIFYRCLISMGKDEPIPPWCIYLVASISFVHIFFAVKELNIHLMRRNILLLTPDWISLIWITILLHKNEELRPNRDQLCVWFLFVCFIVLFYYIVCPYRD